MYLSLYCKGSKRVTQGFTLRGSWRPNRTAIYWPPLLWPSALCLSRSPGLLSQRPRGPALSWIMAFFTVSYHQLVSKTQLEVSRAPSAWPGFPYHILSLTPTVWLLVLTELYNSSTPTQSPTQSLEWHVWSSSSGNNCHAIHRSLSSGASLCSSTVGPSPCPILSAELTCVISFDYGHWDVSLPLSFEWHVCPGQSSKYNTWSPLHYGDFPYDILCHCSSQISTNLLYMRVIQLI